MEKNIKTYEEYNSNTNVVNFSDLDKNWDAKRAVNKKNGKKSYMVVNGEWVESLPSASTYNKHIYATPEEVKELNKEYQLYLSSKKRYGNLLSKYKKIAKPYFF